MGLHTAAVFSEAAELRWNGQMEDFFKFVESKQGRVRMNLIIRLDTKINPRMQREIDRLLKRNWIHVERLPLPKK
jgi:hypothetical protein